MAFIVKQINNGDIVEDYDERLSPKDCSCLLEKYLGNIQFLSGKTRNNIPVYKNTVLLTAQITYLGKPHPTHKKRIQIKNYWIDEYLYFKEKGYDVLFLGIYKYIDTVFFVDFDTQYYIERKANNSSAHVMINDLYQASIYGIFTRLDKNNNKITVIKADLFQKYLSGNLENNESSYVKIFKRFNQEFLEDKRINAVDAVKEMYYSEPMYPFNESWKGYYPDTFQGEWAGFYLEYRFCKFLNKNDLFSDIYFQKAKEHNDELDFDLKFLRANEISYYGDFKSSDWIKNNAPGNDAESVIEAINRYKSLWYVIYEHRTFNDPNLKQLELWNTFKDDVGYFKNRNIPFKIHSYKPRFKPGVAFIQMKILEVNKSNMDIVLSDFKQGHQPDGTSRKPKFLIMKKDIDSFLVYSDSLIGKSKQ